MSQDTDCHSTVSYAIIGMGSNLSSAVGCPEKTLQAALEQLDAVGFGPDLVSNFYETPCFPIGSGPDFVNAAARIPTESSPEDLLKTLHEVERYFGRERKVRWSARCLDLDLLAFDNRIVPNREGFQFWHDLTSSQQITLSPDQLILPHPRIQDRSFVLIPFADIAPEWRHPVLGKTVAEMRDELVQADRDAIKVL